MQHRAPTLTVREALLLVLDQVDYTRGACSVTDMVGACLPGEVIDKARDALAADGKQGTGIGDNHGLRGANVNPPPTYVKPPYCTRKQLHPAEDDCEPD